MGERGDGGRYPGDTFHFNVVALVPLSAHSISTGGKNKSFPTCQFAFPVQGTELGECGDLVVLSSESTFHQCDGLQC